MSLWDRIEIIITVPIAIGIMIYFMLTGDAIGSITALIYASIPLIVTILQFVVGIPLLALLILIAYVVLNKTK